MRPRSVRFRSSARQQLAPDPVPPRRTTSRANRAQARDPPVTHSLPQPCPRHAAPRNALRDAPDATSHRPITHEGAPHLRSRLPSSSPRESGRDAHLRAHPLVADLSCDSSAARLWPYRPTPGGCSVMALKDNFGIVQSGHRRQWRQRCAATPRNACRSCCVYRRRLVQQAG